MSETKEISLGCIKAAVKNTIRKRLEYSDAMKGATVDEFHDLYHIISSDIDCYFDKTISTHVKNLLSKWGPADE